MKRILGRSFPLWATILLLVAIVPATAYIVGQMATNTLTVSATVVWDPYLWLEFDPGEPFPTNPSIGVEEPFGIIVTINETNRERAEDLFITYVINATKSGGGISTGSLDISADINGDIDAMNKNLLGDGTLQFTWDPLNINGNPWVWSDSYYSISSHGFILTFNEAGSYDFTVYAITRSP